MSLAFVAYAPALSALAFGAAFEIAPLTRADKDIIAAFHANARIVTDAPHLPDYIQASVDCGYFQDKWNRWFAARPIHETALKVTAGDKLVAFTLFGLTEKPEFDTSTGAANTWGELHHIYVAPEYQGQGIGKKLFRLAASQLAKAKATHMLINVLEDNQPAREFYDRMGAVHQISVVEQNTRGGKTFAVPCSLYAKTL